MVMASLWFAIFQGVHEVSNSVQADAKFLRRVFLGLVFLTLVTGGMAGFTVVQAMAENSGGCIIFCD